MDTQATWTTIDVNGQPMQGYIAKPAQKGSYPAVIMLMEIFGINSHIQDMARRLAAEGFVVLAPDYYHRVAPKIDLGYTPGAIEEGKSYKAQVSAKDALSDIQASINFLKKQPFVSPKEGFGCIGFCFGGHLSYLGASLPEIKATASFYGAGISSVPLKDSQPTLSITPQIKGAVHCFFGDQDQSIPFDEIHQIEAALKQARVNHKVMVYRNADHGFCCDQRDSYNPVAAHNAWEKVKQLFLEQLSDYSELVEAATAQSSIV